MDVKTIVTLIVAIFASTGFWSFIQNRLDRKDAKTKMILGLGHDRLKYLCEHFINQGWISSDDYEDLYKYLYQPYRQMGGNGAVEKLMGDVQKLPMTKPKKAA